MHTMRRIVTLILAVLLLPVMVFAADDSVFIRIDRDDPDAWKEELANVRFLEEEDMSGSAQFSEEQFSDLAQQLRERSEEVWIVDCRLESHGLINGIAVSWCGEDNGANLGKTVEEVEAEEEALSSLTGTAIMAYTSEDDQPKDSLEMTVEKFVKTHCVGSFRLIPSDSLSVLNAVMMIRAIGTITSMAIIQARMFFRTS